MTRRTYSWNAYESGLSSGVDGVTGSITVDSAAGLAAPAYLVLDPESPTAREYVKVTNIAGNVLTVTRGLGGSAGGTGQPHLAGAKARAVPVHQWLNDIFDDIEDNTSAIAGKFDISAHTKATHDALNIDADTLDGFDSAYFASQTNLTDGLALKVAKAGDTMTGPLVLPGDPTLDLQAAPKQYVDGAVSDAIAPYTPLLVAGRASDTAAAGSSITWTRKAEFNIVRPPSWGTVAWTVEAIATYSVVNGGTPSVPSELFARIDINGSLFSPTWPVTVTDGENAWGSWQAMQGVAPSIGSITLGFDVRLAELTGLFGPWTINWRAYNLDGIYGPV